MEQEVAHGGSVALVVGVTGMVGLSIAEALKKDTTRAGGPWRVYGTARRAMPEWFPTSTIDRYIAFDATDYEDTKEKLSPLSSEVTHVFWVALQVGASEDDNISANTTMLENVLNVLLKSSPSPSLHHVTLQTGTSYYMGPAHMYSENEFIPHEPPFKEDLPQLPYKHFYYPLEDLVASYSPAFTYSIHRPSIIIGASSRSVYNALLTLSVYANICKHEGLPFRYPGTKYTWEHFCDMSDAGVIAEQHIWAATSEKAKNQAFNCTNGDYFTWKSLWKLMCDIFDVEFIVPFKDKEDREVENNFDIVEEMKGKEMIWETIVEQNGLCKTKLEEITCFPALVSVLNFTIQHVSSMNKSRELGFFGYADTFKSIKMWVQRLRAMKIIP